MLKDCSYTYTTTQAHQKLTTTRVPTHKTVHNNVYPNHRAPKCFIVYWLLCHKSNQIIFECLSVPFFGPFREDFHQSEDGFSILILTNKIASGKSETGDGNTMPQVFGNRPDKKERTKHNEHVGKQKGANFTIISATLLHKQHVY